jgi:tetratricopeptide (TPR) repeat protein
VTHRTIPGARLRPAALVCAAALLAACAGPGGGSPASPADEHTEFDLDDGSDADRLLAVGDFEKAAELYEDALREDPDSPVLREKLATARHSAAQVRAARALDAAVKGDADVARRHLAAAEAFAPNAPVVRRTREQLDETLRAAFRARELVRESEPLMENHPEEAQDVLAEARRLDPKNPQIVRLLREATLRAEAARAADRAEKAWDSGQRRQAIRELEGAEFAGRPVGHAYSVRARIEDDLLRETLDAELDTLRAARDISVEASLSSSAVRTIRDRLVAALTGEVQRLLDEGRPAVAALHETECLRLGVNVETPALDAVTQRAQIHVAVRPFDDDTGGDVDGLRLARDLAARLVADARGGGAALGVIEPGPQQERLLAAHPRALRLSGTAIASRVAEGPRNRILRKVPVQIDSRSEPNPEALRAESELRQDQAQLSAVRELIADTQTELDRLNSIPFVRGPSGRRVAQGQANFEIVLARTESRLENLERREEELAAREAASRERMLSTPQQREVPIYGERPVEVLEFRKVAKVTVKLRLEDVDRMLLEADVTGSAVHDEVVAPAIPDAGLDEDPDETPDDAAMVREAAAHFAVVAAGRIRQAAERAARRFLVDARAAERAGRPTDAAEGYALYLLSTAEVASPHRADAARALYDLAGVRVPLRTGAEEQLR